MAGRGAPYLVTGGAGFIGSHLVEHLLGEGHPVRVLDNLLTGRESNLSFTRNLSGDRFEFIRGDVADPEARQRALRGVGTVFHQAAIPSVPRSVRDPRASHDVNATGTLALLVDARDAGVERLVYASSSSVYGESAVLPKVETMAPDPRSPYAVSKLAGELYCRVFPALYGVNCVALRYFNVFGPRQDPGSEYAAVVPRFGTAMLRGESPIVFGDGEQTRDFTFISDVVAANMKAASAGPEAWGRAFNVAGGRRISLLDLLRFLGQIHGEEVTPRFESPRPGDVRHSHADISAASEALGWAPAVSLEEGLRRTMESLSEGVSHAG